MAEAAGPAEHSTATRWLLVLAGLLGVAAGVIVLAKASIALPTLAVITGIFLLVDGIIETVWSVSWSLIGGLDQGQALGVLLAIASAIIGVLLIRHPLRAVVAIALLLGLWLMISGMIRLASTRNLRSGRGWEAGLALIEFVAGIVIVSSPGIGVRTLAIFIGIAFILRGLAMCAVGWLLPSDARGLRAYEPRGGDTLSRGLELR